ncbi:MAG: CoA transferase [Acidimicrobiales bacterium]|nr:CoA transferase [Acidimicrobiales bacterium]
MDDDVERVAAAIRALPSAVLEERVVAAGGVAAAVRSASDWAVHPRGQAIAAEPLIGHRVIPGAPPRVRRESRLPAEEVRVIDLTRIIAGPVCTRYLGALGAKVLRIDPPGKPDLEPGSVADSLLGKRSAALDLSTSAGATVLHSLLHQADVIVCGYRPGSLERFGLGPEDLAKRHPGLVQVYLSAWGHSGPWAGRRGFDSVVQAPTGIALAESRDGEQPGAMPCQLLDHGTGYLAAAAVLDGLRRQAIGGGTHIRTLSLARTAHWLVAGGTRTVNAVTTPNAGGDWIVELGGEPVVTAVAPPGEINGRSLHWPGRPARYLADPPTWAP